MGLYALNWGIEGILLLRDYSIQFPEREGDPFWKGKKLINDLDYCFTVTFTGSLFTPKCCLSINEGPPRLNK